MTQEMSLVAAAAVLAYGACTLTILRYCRRERSSVQKARPKENVPCPPQAPSVGNATQCLARAIPQVCLEVRDTHGERRIPLVAGRFLVGSRDGCDIQVNDRYVSKQHLSLSIAAGGCVRLTDLDSSNGTFVRDERVDRLELQSGDVVHIGESTLRLSSHNPTHSSAIH